MILRIIALNVTPGSYKRPLKKYLNDVMAAHRGLDNLDKDNLEKRFKEAARLLAQGPGPTVIRPYGSAVNSALTEALFVGLMGRLELDSPSLPAVSAATKELLADKEMIASFTKSTADEENVRKRLALATRAFAK
ncbi:hypothetical protein [Arthrobacter sp. UYEF20]|uniref:hypothetical protein n=1 Tax=Arthrobacter sp. UYEF20 TaxID=1756363 RepID=UPI00339664FC